MNKSIISEVMREMGRKGGKIGGKRSLETMTPEERSARAKKASLKARDNRKMKSAKTSKKRIDSKISRKGGK
jgi:hypothetical protein